MTQITASISAAPAKKDYLGTVTSSSLGDVVITERDISLDLDFMYGVRSSLDDCVRVNGILARAVGAGWPMDTTGAQMTDIAVESMCEKLGIKFKATPALEYFKDRSTAMMATKIALESVSEVLKNLVNKVIEWMKKIWEKIKAFFQRMGIRLRLVKQSVQQSIELVKTLSSIAKPVDEYIEDKVATEDAQGSSYLDHHILFGIHGKCDSTTALEIVQNTSTLIRINREIILNIVACLKEISDAPPEDDELNHQAEKLVREIKDKMSRFTLLNKKHEDNKVVYSYGHFHDSEVFKLREAVGMSQDDQRVRLFNVDLTTEKVKDAPYRVKTLSVGEMSKLAVETMRLVEATEDFKKVIPIVEKVLHFTADTLHTYYNLVSTDDARLTVTQALNMIHDLFNYVGHHLPTLAASAIRVATDSSTYVRASVDRHKPKKAA